MDPHTPYLSPKYSNKYKKHYGNILENIIFSYLESLGILGLQSSESLTSSEFLEYSES